MLDTLQMLNKGLWKQRIQFPVLSQFLCAKCLLEAILESNGLGVHAENRTLLKQKSMLTDST